MKRNIVVAVVFTALAVFFTTVANAGVMEVIKSIGGVAKEGGLWAGLGCVVLLYVFKKIPNEKIYEKVKAFAKGLGTIVTLGLAKWKFTAPVWNKIIEPWITDFIDNTIGAFVEGFILGLRTDNTENGNG